jgi:putative ABC transport system ATP-binding protein
MELIIEGLRKTYRKGKNREVKAVNGVSLKIAKGEMVTVSGSSGCGKTTLLLMAGGLMNPDEGKVYQGDTDLYSLSHKKRNRVRALKVGFVFQQFYLIPYLSVLENVLIPSIELNSSRSDAELRARDLISRFKLDGRIDHRPGELSTGERQRVALARALINRPTVLFADEPTGNLDDANTKLVLEYIQEFAEEDGAVLLVTHDARIGKKANRSYEMRDGRLLKN